MPKTASFVILSQPGVSQVRFISGKEDVYLPHYEDQVRAVLVCIFPSSCSTFYYIFFINFFFLMYLQGMRFIVFIE